MRQKQPRSVRLNFRNRVRAMIDGKITGTVSNVSPSGCLICCDSWVQVDKQIHAIRLELPQSKAIVLEGTIQRARLEAQSTDQGLGYALGFLFDRDSEEFNSYQKWLVHVSEEVEAGHLDIFVSDDRVLTSRIQAQIERMDRSH